MSSPELYTLNGEEYTIKKDADKAILIETTDGQSIWLPKSQLESYDKDEIVMAAWLAKEKGLIS